MTLFNASGFQQLQSYGSLTALDPYWASVVADVTPFDLAFRGCANVVGVATVCASLICFLMDFVPSLRKYKMQPTRLPTLALYWKCLKLALLNQVVVHAPVQLALLYFWGGRPTFSGSLPLPSVLTIVCELALFILCEDFLFYWSHRFLHWKRIFKHVHKVHHEFTAPFGLAFIYTHPVEEVLTMMATMTGPLLFGSHILCLYIWLVFRVVKSIEAHSGYEFPLGLNTLIPFLTGSGRHDYHHEKFDCNYGSMFAFWDWICGTDANFRKMQFDKAARGESASFDLFDYLSPALSIQSVKTKDM
ncbi:Aste57867_2062 [Aphanomyces stellatus]|uniref:Aste57867_2062 protein n=1 Tax=Aphanomyces stellatus TaxID=120398 RepID=A0A485K6T0_9STRA|nr:hypothetical protein As57867_002058 [Aphanomyces stellatus]VFT79266.1 Aste57867_2062 [Aphanomyces stellatus]